MRGRWGDSGAIGDTTSTSSPNWTSEADRDVILSVYAAAESHTVDVKFDPAILIVFHFFVI